MARIRSSLSDPEWIAARFANDLAFEGHPYAQNSGGTLTTLANITSDDLREFVKTRLARKTLKISVVGDITAEEAATMIDNIFSSLPATQSTPGQINDISLRHDGQTFLYSMDIPQTIAQGMLPGISRENPDYYAFVVMNQILGAGGFGSRLTEEIREKRGLTYGIDTSLTEMTHVDVLTLSVATENKNVGEVLKLASLEIQKMASEEVSNTELANAVSYINGSLPLTLSSTSNIAGLLLGMQLDNLPADYLDKRAARFNAVTKADIQRVASKYLKPDTMTTILVGQPVLSEEDIKNVKTLTTIPNVE